MFDLKGEFSAADLAAALKKAPAEGRAEIVCGILKTAFRLYGREPQKTRLESLQVSRLLHTLGSAVLALGSRGATDEPAGASSSIKTLTSDRRAGTPAAKTAFPPRKKNALIAKSVDADEGTTLIDSVYAALSASERRWLHSLGLPDSASTARASSLDWARAAQNTAFDTIGRTIVLTQTGRASHPRNALRTDEIIWGRAPARLDLGGGWSDTPPYSLEHGGCVINAAVDLNGQPPIQVFARVIDEPEIRINSIDHGSRLIIRSLDELLDYRQATSQFGLAKAALALSGFAPGTAPWPPRARRSLTVMLELFGGGIELDTLAAIPSGSGLGTSSIMGAVLVAVIHRMIGDRLSERELFHAVLKLEQELTTGGGWQDQIGGVMPGVKVITTGPGLMPDPWIHYVLPDLLDPKTNGGATLLYYTGIRRLAKNILRFVVGHYLDRDAAALATLRDLHAYPIEMREAMAAKDRLAFGRLIDVAWKLNKRIDPDSTTPAIEAILKRIKPRILGAKLLGAGGGGFLLVVAKSPRDARAVRRALEASPPNPRARFFDYEISAQGLTVTVC
jgi:galactokinase/mevalonate kinase-like predicted kinase